MSKYIITSDKFSGELLFEFGIDGRLKGFQIASDQLTTEQHIYVCHKLPITEAEISRYKTESSRVRQVIADLSFGAFWEAYNYKVGKKKASAIWERLSDKTRLAALEYIPNYESDLIRRPVAKMYPETYLTQERWNDNK